jgi:uncharacterized protein YodC (DUF2158 family)
MADIFKLGDTVKLASGGPDMTVSYVTAGGDVLCEWFDNNGTLQQAGFKASLLVQAPETKPGLSA